MFTPLTSTAPWCQGPPGQTAPIRFREIPAIGSLHWEKACSNIRWNCCRAFAEPWSRSLRAVVDLPKLGERQITVDCDVIQADGGTRTASISGGWVALRIAVDKLREAKSISVDPIRTQVAAVSCGIHNGAAVLDLDYEEDSQAGCDGNFVLTADGSIVEAQVTAEGECYDEEGLLRLLRLARIGCSEIFQAQLKAARG